MNAYRYPTRQAALFTLWVLSLVMLPGSVLAQDSDSGDVAEVIAQARTVHSEAQGLGHGWSVTLRYIEEAETALAEGRADDAMAAAERAALTARQSVVQAKAEQADWSSRVPAS